MFTINIVCTMLRDPQECVGGTVVVFRMRLVEKWLEQRGFGPFLGYVHHFEQAYASLDRLFFFKEKSCLFQNKEPKMVNGRGNVTGVLD